jgi:hypothetical protein
MRAWEELDGNPNHHVIRFHTIAPHSAPNTTYWSTILVSMMPLPTVDATFSWNTPNATTLKNAASITAWCGFSTPVDTTVAMEFAAS